MSDLARRYAQALYGLTDDEEALRRTAGALMEDTALWAALRSPAVRAEEKERILARLPDLEGCGTLLHFYQLLAVKGRMDLLPEILDAFRDLALAQRDCARCVLTCVRPLEAAELSKLRLALCRLHHKRDILFDVRMDPSLLGGFTLELEGVTYDKSVHGALAGLTRQLEERRMA